MRLVIDADMDTLFAATIEDGQWVDNANYPRIPKDIPAEDEDF